MQKIEQKHCSTFLQYNKFLSFPEQGWRGVPLSAVQEAILQYIRREDPSVRRAPQVSQTVAAGRAARRRRQENGAKKTVRVQVEERVHEAEAVHASEAAAVVQVLLVEVPQPSAVRRAQEGQARGRGARGQRGD